MYKKISLKFQYKESLFSYQNDSFTLSYFGLFEKSNKNSKIHVKRCIFLAHFPPPCENAALMSRIKNDGWQDSEVRLASSTASQPIASSFRYPPPL